MRWENKTEFHVDYSYFLMFPKIMLHSCSILWNLARKLSLIIGECRVPICFFKVDKSSLASEILYILSV